MIKEKNKNNNSNMILMFPGQGSQHVNMGMDFLSFNKIYFDYLKKASDLLGKDLSKIIRNKDTTESLIDDTRFSQISIFCISAAINDYIINDLGLDKTKIKAVIGHSLGDYNALYCSGAFNFIDGAELVIMRGKLMGNLTKSDSANIDNIGESLTAKDENHYKGSGEMMMAAVLGSDMNTIKSVLAHYNDTVFVANYNDYSQIVISGYKYPVLKASEEIKKAGAKRIVPLKVNIASHSPLMGDVSIKLAKYIKKNLNDFKGVDKLVPDFFSSTELVYIYKDKIKEVLKNQLISPIKWIDSIEMLISDGADTFIEIGPGRVLSSLVSRIVKHNGYDEISIFNTGSVKEIKNLIDFLKSNNLMTY